MSFSGNRLSGNKRALVTFQFILMVFFATASFAQAQMQSTVPACMGGQGPLPINDAQVLQYKVSTPNQFLARAHIQGILQHAYADQTGHSHFEVKIGPGPKDNIEIIYNQSFGPLPQLRPGISVEACGDYITSNNSTPRYPASPDGAIMHWVHRSTDSHLSGFLVVAGVLCGQGTGNGDD